MSGARQERSAEPTASPTVSPAVSPTVHQLIAAESAEDSRWLRWSVGVALVVHIALFVVQWPDLVSAKPRSQDDRELLFVVRNYVVKPPPKRELEIKVPRREVPMPDPDPDDPEPQREQRVDEVDYVEQSPSLVTIPVAPPPSEPEGPFRFTDGGGITEPQRISTPMPHYPEGARRAHMEGAVVLECIIDKNGMIRDVTVLSGRPLGLTEAAVEAVRRWRFRPSTLNGTPVEVIYQLTVNFFLN